MKFNRSTLKANAKIGLRRYYWLAFGVTLVLAAVSLVTYAFATDGSGGIKAFLYEIGIYQYPVGHNIIAASILEFLGYSLANNFTLFTVLTAAVALFAILWLILVVRPLTVGKCSFFLESRRKEAHFGYLWGGFRSDYRRRMWGMLSVGLIILFYTSLALIPAYASLALYNVTDQDNRCFLLTLLAIPLLAFALAKVYQYKLVPYILADDPTATAKEARARSREMTKGHKRELLLLELSFIPLLWLGMLLCFVGVLFVLPYVEATMAEAYCFLKADFEARDAALPTAAEAV